MRFPLLAWGILYLAPFLLTALPASAQSGPQGIAFVNAPEQAYAVCFGDNADTAFNCARDRCVEQGADRADCLRVAWCYPAGHAGTMGIMVGGEFHFTTQLCGAPTRQALIEMLTSICREQPRMTACYLGTAYAPDGSEEAIGLEFSREGLGLPPLE
ncbi:MAG: hypothetical protein KDI98_05350 [Hyphomicrobiaceae bacterium]|nr:hypothetical protein [Hyphomicrobiaceae bacterium]